ncbi:DNA-processing protein DprA [Coprothermobacter platensis]|uniref:DNA-processing protein DprA n=1 Tax=Coprothermobacter platensis TaxID=108819 RepID=UPI000373FFBC|nr:DNA-processing protein DprA [Coprothermobacter platensis]
MDYVLNGKDPLFNDRLADLDPKRSLYLRGNRIGLERTVGIVGTRHASPYGLRIAYELGRYYACEGYVVISGLAYGVDEKGHEGALSVGGKTVGVLGHGLNHHYPKATLPIRKQIEQTSFVISWYEPDQGPRKPFFRERNWLIAALSDFIVVVEAPLKSGALITASFALEMGKDVKAVPGDIDRPSAAGSNLLILDGAEPIVSVPESEMQKYKSCKTLQDIIAVSGSLVEAGRLLAKWQSTGMLTMDGDIIKWRS